MTTDETLRPYPFEVFKGDLPAELLRMVMDAPVSRVRLPDGRATWLVLGYEEACTVLSDTSFTRHAGDVAAEPATDKTAGEATDEAAGGCPVRPKVRELGMNGQAHTSLRRLAARAFTARRIESYRPRVQQIADELLDAMEAAGPPADLISGLVAPLPALVVYEVLGVPSSDVDKFNAWVADINSITAYGSPDAARSVADLRAYLGKQLDRKRIEPGDDLLSAWLATPGDDELSDEEIIGLAVAVLIGGREINSISAGMRALFQHPEQLERLRADAALIGPAVDEILRYTSVSPMFLVQTAVHDVRIGGVDISAGDPVMAVPWAANRDVDAFERADEFDISRTPNPHLTFGHGPHFCLGAALGRLEVEIAISSLLRRFPALAPAVPIDELPWRPERINCGILEFPVTW